MAMRPSFVSNARLVPELDVRDLPESFAFYVDVCGFTVVYDRPEERFAYLDLDRGRADASGRRTDRGGGWPTRPSSDPSAAV